MGYTHYWNFKAPGKGQSDKVESLYQRAVKDCQKVILAYQETAEGLDRLSGYSAHTKLGQYKGIKLNGKQENSHEDFLLREHYKENLELDCYGFCKTNRKPYDTVVVACLTVLKDVLGDLVKVSTDGRHDDLDAGIELASKVLKREFQSPVEGWATKREIENVRLLTGLRVVSDIKEGA